MNIYDEIAAAIRQGEPCCLLTIVATKGSTPRGAGAKMLLRRDGSTVGTIGGGQLEAAALEDARQAMSLGRDGTRLAEYEVYEGDRSLGICGGTAQVFIEVLEEPATLVIAGGGHVGKALAQMAHLVGYRTVVYDDRAEFASAEMHPHVDELVHAPFEEFAQRVAFGPDTAVVIVTHGHDYDELVLRQVLEQEIQPGYLGMIGSAKKVATLFEHLAAEGIPRERLARVHTPIGLSIGGQTPGDIALSIMAEVAMVRNGGKGEPMSKHGNPYCA